MRLFVLELALALGMTPRQVLATHTAADIAEWQAFVRIRGPFGDERQDLRAARLAYLTAAPWRTEGQHLTEAQFMRYSWNEDDPRYREREATPAEIAAAFRAAFGDAADEERN